MSRTFSGPPPAVIVFDVDGTLYDQAPLRRAMLLRLLAGHVGAPIRGYRTLAALRAYRHAQEELRAGSGGDMAAEQIRLTCERTGIDRAFVEACVERWMEREPLPLLRGCIHAGLDAFLERCRSRDVRMAALSDYPADAKLTALGIRDYFEVVLSAQSREIGAFKPDPRGIRVALDRMNVTADRALYVGDRADVDAAAAAAAGVRCVILSRSPAPDASAYTGFQSFRQLQDLLFAEGRPSVVVNQVA